MKPSTTIHHRHPFTHLSDSDSSDSDSPKHHDHTDFSNTIFQSYIQFSNLESPDLTKIQSFLTSSRSGALSCLICLERIRPTDPIWSCNLRCFSVFHLLCIQSWARQSSEISSLRAATHGADDSSSTWNCPKCRIEFPKTLIPKTYTCFCGKAENPCHDPWVLPHSCGEICNRPLKYDCGHKCLLLCHPGPCPACPKSVKARCFCGSVEDVKRCGFKNFSCKKVCSKLLDCKVHCCVEICHEGECPPCRASRVYGCQCGKVKAEKECCERDFRCEIECEKMLGCGKHVCSKGCHEGECGDCPLQGKRTCPCGKRFYERMACDVVLPSCGGTCDKKLQCGIHRCPERCHRGNCVETCRIVITKSCKCGSLRKQVPCYQDVVCERKCQQVRDCGRHPCKRRCCDGDCPPCSEICDKRLRCKNHKCPSPCHRGACAPCPVMETISCFCGQTRFEVPCGTEKEQKPPKCSQRCRITPLCRHKSITKPHKCHYGACPPCRLVCDEEYPCGHKCKLRCHGPIPPPNPEFTLKPKKKKQYLQSESTPGSTCPPCPELVCRPCVGEHIGSQRMMVCSNKAKFSCDNYCGNLHGNHLCTKTCQQIEIKKAEQKKSSNSGAMSYGGEPREHGYNDSYAGYGNSYDGYEAGGGGGGYSSPYRYGSDSYGRYGPSGSKFSSHYADYGGDYGEPMGRGYKDRYAGYGDSYGGYGAGGSGGGGGYDTSYRSLRRLPSRYGSGYGPSGNEFSSRYVDYRGDYGGVYRGGEPPIGGYSSRYSSFGSGGYSGVYGDRGLGGGGGGGYGGPGLGGGGGYESGVGYGGSGGLYGSRAGYGAGGRYYPYGR